MNARMTMATDQSRNRGQQAASRRAIDRYANAHDASHFLLVPDQVVIAGGADDVVRLMKECARRRRGITFRSGGTSLSGQGVTDALLVDVRRGFRRIEVLDAGARVRVGPGATVRQVNARLAPYGRVLGPDPASEVACTVGGVIANNSSGMSCGTESNVYRTLESLRIVLPSGTLVDTGAPDADKLMRDAEPALFEGLVRLRARVRANPASIREIQRQFAMKNTMGYGLNAFVDFDTPSQILAHLIVGSEGTLAFISEATIRTVPLFPAAATGLMVFSDLRSANQALPALVSTGATAIELMDAAALRVGRQAADAPPAVRQIEVHEHAALLVEYRAESSDALADLTRDAQRMLGGEGQHPLSLSADPVERAALWRIRKGLYATIAGARATGTTALLEDVVVPVPSLASTCADLGSLFDAHGYRDSVIFGHAKDGNIHFMLTDRFEGPGLLRYEAFTEDLVELVLAAGGSLKAEHGTGRVMAPFVRRQYGDELYEVMRSVKTLFDPDGILNPGVIVTDDPRLHLRDIKVTPTIEPEADRCVECGYCEPVCPSKDLTLTPRQRIVVKRDIASARSAGDHELADELEAQYTYSGLETCAVDGMCQTTCPVLINTGDLVRRLRSDTHAAAESAVWNTAAAHWNRATQVASIALTAAHALPSGLVRGPNAAARKLVGEEVLPLWSEELPRGGSRRSRRQSTMTEPEAVYVPACVNAMFGSASVGVQRSFEQLCDLAGVSIVIPEDIDNLCCATPWSSKGFTRGKAIMSSRVLAALREATRGGELPVICDASSCTEGLVAIIESDRSEPRLRVVDAVEFVATRVLPALPDLEKVDSVVVHPTCSSTRLGINAHLDALASAIARNVMVPAEWSCCAFAGDRGMLHPELTASATHRESEEVAAHEAAAHVSCNRTCELGMTRSTGRTYTHIIELLAGMVSPTG